MKRLIFQFETFNIIVDFRHKLPCEIWINGTPSWCGTVKDLKNLLEQVNESSPLTSQG